jgi:hypothetical protein
MKNRTKIFLSAAIVCVATAAYAASSGDRLKSPVKVGQATNVTESITFDQGFGTSNSQISATSGTITVSAPAVVAGSLTAQSGESVTGNIVATGNIDAGGRLGIGTSGTPNANLDVLATNALPGFTSATIYINDHANKSFKLGMDTTNNAVWLQGENAGTGAMPMYLNPVGGNVGIGTASTQATVDVSGSSGVPENDNTNQLLKLRNGTNGDQLVFGVDAVGHSGWIQSYEDGVSNTRLYLQNSGGPVNIGNGSVPSSSVGGNVPHQCVVRTAGAVSTYVSVSCGGGEMATGGGCSTPVTGGGVTNSSPSGGSTTTAPTGWSCDFASVSALDNAAYVVCCSY